MSAAERVEDGEFTPPPGAKSPNAGPQSAFVSSSAKIAIFGGARGGGKSYGLLFCPLEFVGVPRFGGAIFRREFEMVKGPGSIWEDAATLWPLAGGIANNSEYYYRWPGGTKLKLYGLEHEGDVRKHQGRSYAFIGVEELTQFEESQFWGLYACLRSVSGVQPFMRCTCNPDPDSWVLRLIRWWIYPDGHALAGYAIPERAGVIRWLVRRDDQEHWFDSHAEAMEAFPDLKPEVPISFTYIASRLEDNPQLMANDPSYLGNLQALPRHQRLQFYGDGVHGGNWFARLRSGDLFRRDWFEMVDVVPKAIAAKCRGWDKAATEKSEANPDPDWTVGVKVGRLTDGRVIVLDVVRMRGTPGAVDKRMEASATGDGVETLVGLWQDPAQAGVVDIEHTKGVLRRFRVDVERAAEDKVTYAESVSPDVEQGRFLCVRAEWNDAFFAELEAFPKCKHKDQVDAFVRAVRSLRHVYKQEFRRVGGQPSTTAREPMVHHRNRPQRVRAGLV